MLCSKGKCMHLLSIVILTSSASYAIIIGTLVLEDLDYDYNYSGKTRLQSRGYLRGIGSGYACVTSLEA
jgi:hypothetical protein